MLRSGNHFLDSSNNLLGGDAIHVHEHTARSTAGNAGHCQAMDTHIGFLAEGTTHCFTKSTCNSNAFLLMHTDTHTPINAH